MPLLQFEYEAIMKAEMPSWTSKSLKFCPRRLNEAPVHSWNPMSLPTSVATAKQKHDFNWRKLRPSHKAQEHRDPWQSAGETRGIH